MTGEKRREQWDSLYLRIEQVSELLDFVKTKTTRCVYFYPLIILACKGVDQRVIDSFMGHQTEEMRRRYRHLFPEQRMNAIDSLFGLQPDENRSVTGVGS